MEGLLWTISLSTVFMLAVVKHAYGDKKVDYCNIALDKTFKKCYTDASECEYLCRTDNSCKMYSIQKIDESCYICSIEHCNSKEDCKDWRQECPNWETFIKIRHRTYRTVAIIGGVTLGLTFLVVLFILIQKCKKQKNGSAKGRSKFVATSRLIRREHANLAIENLLVSVSNSVMNQPLGEVG